MPAHWPLVPLGEVLARNEERITLVPEQTYREVTVRLWGKGVTLRRLATGAEIAGEGRFVVRTNQFIASRIDARNGAFGLIPPELDGAIVTNDFPTFNVDSSRLLPEFLGWQCRTSVFVDLARAASEGTTNRVRLKGASFLATTIPLPPVEEQRRIVARVDAIASRVAEARRLREEAAAQVAALKANETSRFFAPSGAEAKQTRLREIVESHDSGWSPQCSDEPAEPGAWGVLKTTCVQWEGFDAKQNKKLLLSDSPRAELQVAVGDVLVTRAGPVNRVGVACAVLEAVPNLMLSDKIVRLRLRNDVLPRYLALALSSADCQEYFRHGKTGLAESQVNISREKLLALPLRVPPLGEQRRVVAHLDALQAKLDAVRAVQSATAAELDALLPSVLNQAFAGKL